MMSLWKWMKLAFCLIVNISFQCAFPSGQTHCSKKALLPSDKQVLRIGIPVHGAGDQELFSYLNPYAVTNNFHLFIHANIFEGLVVSKGSQLLPGLAERWEYSRDFRQWVFRIRPGAYWSDGIPVRAQDFVLGWRSLCSLENYLGHSKVESIYTMQSVPIRNAMDIIQGRLPVEQLGVYAQDDKTLCFELERPIIPEVLLPRLAGHLFYPMRPEHLETFALKPLGEYARLPACGAFALSGLQFPDNLLILTKNRCYWDQAQVLLQEVQVALRPEAAALTSLWKKGALDLYPLGWECSKEERGYIWNLRSSTWFGIYLDCYHRWLGNKKIRQALNLLFHRERIIQAISAGNSRTPLFGLLPPDSKVRQSVLTQRQESGWDLSLEERKNRARELLKEGLEEELAKQGRGVSLQELLSKGEGALMVLTFRHGFSDHSEVAKILDRALNQHPDLLQVRRVRGKPHQMNFGGVFDGVHPFDRFTLFREFYDPKSHANLNLTGFSHKGYNALVQALESGVGRPQEAAEVEQWLDEKLYQLDQVFREELPCIPIQEVVMRYVMHPEVGGLPRADYPGPDSTHHYSGALYFRYLFIQKASDPEAPKTRRERSYAGFKEEVPKQKGKGWMESILEAFMRFILWLFNWMIGKF